MHGASVSLLSLSTSMVFSMLSVSCVGKILPPSTMASSFHLPFSSIHDHQLEEVYVNEVHLTFFATYMANIEESHPRATESLEQGAISVARSFIPCC